MKQPSQKQIVQSRQQLQSKKPAPAAGLPVRTHLLAGKVDKNIGVAESLH